MYNVEKELEQKAELVKKFGELLASFPDGVGYKIVSMEFDKERKVVKIHFKNGFCKEVNIKGDSCLAILKDVIGRLLY